MRGFSLIEILIVIALIGGIALISFPVWRSAVCSADLKNDAKEITAQLRLAQQNTITEQTAYLVRFDNLNNQYHMIRVYSEDEEIIQSLSLKEHISFQKISRSGSVCDCELDSICCDIKFTSIGSPSSPGAGEIFLESDDSSCQDKTKQINITPAGYIY